MVKELNKFLLSAIAIIGLAIIVLIGIAVSTTFSKVLRSETTVNGSSTEMSLEINSSVAVGASGVFPFLQTLSGCVNASNNGTTALSDSFFVIGEGNADGGSMTLNQDGLAWDSTGVNCTTLGYLASTSGQVAADRFTTGLGTFGVFAVILVLAIVGKAIIRTFKRKD